MHSTSIYWSEHLWGAFIGILCLPPLSVTFLSFFSHFSMELFLIISILLIRRLLFGRKVMTNLDSILKSRDITLPTKVRLVKAMVFLVVVYGCESWRIKKAEC